MHDTTAVKQEEHEHWGMWTEWSDAALNRQDKHRERKDKKGRTTRNESIKEKAGVLIIWN